MYGVIKSIISDIDDETLESEVGQKLLSFSRDCSNYIIAYAKDSNLSLEDHIKNICALMDDGESIMS